MRQHNNSLEQIRPWDTLACCWDVNQPTNKQACLTSSLVIQCRPGHHSRDLCAWECCACSQCARSCTPTLGIDFGWRGLRKIACEWVKKAERWWKQRTTNCRKATKEEMERKEELKSSVSDIPWQERTYFLTSGSFTSTVTDLEDKRREWTEWSKLHRTHDWNKTWKKTGDRKAVEREWTDWMCQEDKYTKSTLTER